MLHKKDNDPPFRDEQRAWYDTLRDFAPAILNLKPTVRLFSKDRAWCELHPENQKDMEFFKKKLFGGRVSVGESEPGTRGLKIGLVSMTANSDDFNNGYVHHSIDDHAKIFLDIVNAHEDLDIIVFPGWTFLDNDLGLVKNGIKNKKSLVILETWKEKGAPRGYYFIEDGVLHDKSIAQRFAKSDEMDKSKYSERASFINEIKDKRIIEHKGMKICWLICGEINVLRSSQENGNKVEFRFSEDNDLKEEFQKIYNETDIFINPTHTIMGEQGKLAQKRKFFSQGKKVFCSVSNADVADSSKKSQKLTGNAAQYLYKSEQAINGVPLKSNSQFILREYDIFRN